MPHFRSHPALVAACLTALAACPAIAQVQGPSSSATPYVLPSLANWQTTSILTVGDTVNNKPDGVTPYRMVGIPDGLGAYDNNNGTFTVLMNHELGTTAGVARAHGATGAFVSKWIINKSDLSVVNGSDLVQQVSTWNTTNSSYNAPASGPLMTFGRLCSADLANQSAYFYDPTPSAPASGDEVGTQNKVFLSGEEVGADGRAFGHVVDGTEAGISYELPRLGKFSWENAVASPSAGSKTIVFGLDDSTPGETYLYVGNKQTTGSTVAKAGLTNGSLYGIKVDSLQPANVPINSSESRDNALGNGSFSGTSSFSLHAHGNVENTTGTALDLADEAAGVTDFLRPEDGAWDPNNPSDFYFVTTDRFDEFKNGADVTGNGTIDQVGRSRLYRLRFTDINDPTLGGQITSVLADTHAGQMFDNMTITDDGLILMQEDVGGQDHLGKMWVHDIDGATNNLTQLASHSGAFFTTGSLNFITRDEEASGIIDISSMFGGVPTYLFDVQAHAGTGNPETVEFGQLAIISAVPEPTGIALLAAGAGLLFGRRRQVR